MVINFAASVPSLIVMQTEYFCIIVGPDSSTIFSLEDHGDILNRYNMYMNQQDAQNSCD